MKRLTRAQIKQVGQDRKVAIRGGSFRRVDQPVVRVAGAAVSNVELASGTAKRILQPYQHCLERLPHHLLVLLGGLELRDELVCL